ncbi:MAG: hypothetical protein WBA51_04205 [Erythrobacter sp.]
MLAMDRLAEGIGVKIKWCASGKNSSLIERARHAIGTTNEPYPPVFTPWKCYVPTAFQAGIAAQQLPRAKWVASYLFDSGVGRPIANPTIDLVLMSPLPIECQTEDSVAPAMPRLGVLKAMLNAMQTEGRRRLAIILPEANQNSMAALLVMACDAATRSDVEVEILSIEQAVVRIQSNEFNWEAVIAMPELRGIVFAMLSEWAGVSAPWPMLWQGQALNAVTSEALGIPAKRQLDATLLMQALALAARKGGCGTVAERLHESWAVLRDRGVVTPSRSLPTPYVKEVSEADFVDIAATARPRDGRALPKWKGVASGRPAEAHREARSASLALVQSR